MSKFTLILFLPYLLFFVISCTEYTPKPTGYIRIERDDVDFKKSDFGDFSFFYPENVNIERVEDEKEGIWFNLIYPEYNAVIYCTYIPVSRSGFAKIVEDNYRMVYSHALRSQSVEQKVYSFPLENVYGIIYDINGSVATPIQFYATDSVSHFLRGSLYFDKQIISDSIMPVVNIVENDILTLFESLKWNKK